MTHNPSCVDAIPSDVRVKCDFVTAKGEKLMPALKKRPVYTCCEHSDELHKAFGIAVDKDSIHVHPKKLCKPC